MNNELKSQMKSLVKVLEGIESELQRNNDLRQENNDIFAQSNAMVIAQMEEEGFEIIEEIDVH